MKKMKRRLLEDPPKTQEEIEEDLDDEGLEDEEEDWDEEDEEDEEEDWDDEEEDEEEDDEEEDVVAFHRGPTHRARRGFSSFDVDDEELSEEMESAIRAGKYKPKRHDPWTAHTLYSMLKDLGKL
jgi:hypothetical protein